MIRYRDGGLDDAPAIRTLFAESFTATFGHLYPPEDLAQFLDGFTDEAWREEIGDPRYAFRLAETGDGVLAGFAKFGPLSMPVPPAPDRAELRQLYILKPWHGTGVADALMYWSLAEARGRGVREFYLSVYVDNHRARRFYARYGFERIGSYAFKVGEQEDEDLIMRLELEE